MIIHPVYSVVFVFEKLTGSRLVLIDYPPVEGDIVINCTTGTNSEVTGSKASFFNFGVYKDNTIGGV